MIANILLTAPDLGESKVPGIARKWAKVADKLGPERSAEVRKYVDELYGIKRDAPAPDKPAASAPPASTEAATTEGN
jgi:hypothetical protein